MNDFKRKIIASYYKEKSFVQWLIKNNFKGSNENNIRNYYFIFQHYLMCGEKRCYDCAKLVPIWKSEEDIIKGNIRHKKCELNETIIKEQAAIDAYNKIKMPPGFGDININNIREKFTISTQSFADIKEYVTKFPHNNPQGLYIHTMNPVINIDGIVCAIIKELLEKLKITGQVIFKPTMKLIQDLTNDSRTNDHVFSESIKQCEMLVLTDFGEEHHTDRSVSELKMIIDGMLWRNKPIILASHIPNESWAWSEKVQMYLISKINRATKTINLDVKNTNKDKNN